MGIADEGELAELVEDEVGVEVSEGKPVWRGLRERREPLLLTIRGIREG